MRGFEQMPDAIVSDPLIRTLDGFTLAGMRRQVTLSNDVTPLIWQQFMPRVKEIESHIPPERYSVQVFHPATDFAQFTPETCFDKWAAVEIGHPSAPLPEGMERLHIPGGLYLTFYYRGHPAGFADVFRFVCFGMLSECGFEIDPSRPLFDIIGAAYSLTNPLSEEEICIPVKSVSHH